MPPTLIIPNYLQLYQIVEGLVAQHCIDQYLYGRSLQSARDCSCNVIRFIEGHVHSDQIVHQTRSSWVSSHIAGHHCGISYNGLSRLHHQIAAHTHHQYYCGLTRALGFAQRQNKVSIHLAANNDLAHPGAGPIPRRSQNRPELACQHRQSQSYYNKLPRHCWPDTRHRATYPFSVLRFRLTHSLDSHFTPFNLHSVPDPWRSVDKKISPRTWAKNSCRCQTNNCRMCVNVIKSAARQTPSQHLELRQRCQQLPGWLAGRRQGRVTSGGDECYESCGRLKQLNTSWVCRNFRQF